MPRGRTKRETIPCVVIKADTNRTLVGHVEGVGVRPDALGDPNPFTEREKGGEGGDRERGGEGS